MKLFVFVSVLPVLILNKLQADEKQGKNLAESGYPPPVFFVRI